MAELSVRQHGHRVGLVLDGRGVGELVWDEAAELGHILFRKGFELERDPLHVGIYQVGPRSIRMMAGRVEVLYKGGLVADMEVSTARRLGRALVAVSRRAEECAKAYEVAADAAVLMRAGVGGLGLAQHPDVLAEALKLALHDRELRRFMANRITERSVVGTPEVIHAGGCDDDQQGKGGQQG